VCKKQDPLIWSAYWHACKRHLHSRLLLIVISLLTNHETILTEANIVHRGGYRLLWKLCFHKVKLSNSPKIGEKSGNYFEFSHDLDSVGVGLEKCLLYSPTYQWLQGNIIFRIFYWTIYWGFINLKVEKNLTFFILWRVKSIKITCFFRLQNNLFLKYL